jgi:hypothetical protein
MRSDSIHSRSEHSRIPDGGGSRRGPALFVALAAALLFGSFLAARGRSEPECCALPPPYLTVNVLDEDGSGVSGARVSLFDLNPPAYVDTLMGGDTLAEGDTLVHRDTLPTYSDTSAMYSDTSVDAYGWMAFSPPVGGNYRLTLTPPRGWAVADSSTADTTVYMDSTGIEVRFVLRRRR